ncbi:MAG: substrate-binding domain-containing protein, partial [Planctomycetes bacterium]|nr:substrate-binding domain-containing protein [Planctomycetota bacterium]
DELLGRSHDPSRFDGQEAELRSDRYEIRATFTDEFDRGKSKALVQDALTRWPDVNCLVGLFEYEPPLILEAVQSANRLGEVKIIGFDEADGTLQGIVDGHIAGTIVQDPFEYGRQSMLLLDRLWHERDAAKRAALLPAGGFLDIPVRRITKANVGPFWSDKNEKLGNK